MKRTFDEVTTLQYNKTMSTTLIIVLLIALFYLLGKTADMVVLTIRRIGELFDIRVFFLGILLGLFTALPEFSIAINALITGIPEISLGNLLGGIVVLLSLVLGGSILLNRSINTDGKVSNILPILIYLFLPIIAGLDGNLNILEGLTFIVAYFLLIFHLFKQNKNHEQAKRIEVKKSLLLKNGFVVLAGVVFIILISNLIIRLTQMLLQNYDIPAFIVGLLIFSIGTNLPEISVMIRSWFRKVQELSIGNLMGSAIAHVLIIGILSFTRTIYINLNASYLSLFFFISILLVAFAYFYRTGHSFSFREGIMLLIAYLAFVGSQIFFLLAGA